MLLIWLHSKTWRDANLEHAEKNLNIRDFASINELAVLSNLETANAQLVKQEITKKIRFEQLSEIAQYQLKIMSKTNLTKSIKRLTDETYIDEVEGINKEYWGTFYSQSEMLIIRENGIVKKV